MRALMENEKPPRGAWDLKMRPGGLVDLEFTVQLLQLAHAKGGGPLRPGVAEALEVLVEHGLLDEAKGRALLESWRLQAGLAQWLGATLEPDADPAEEPEPYRRKLARAGGARSLDALERKLSRVQSRTRSMWRAVAVATERGV
jgi:glutamate-ammonia-ligase adenylyltransferase